MRKGNIIGWVWKIVIWAICAVIIIFSALFFSAIIQGVHWLDNDAIYTYKTAEGSLGEAKRCNSILGNMTCEKDDGTKIQVVEYKLMNEMELKWE